MSKRMWWTGFALAVLNIAVGLSILSGPNAGGLWGLASINILLALGITVSLLGESNGK